MWKNKEENQARHSTHISFAIFLGENDEQRRKLKREREAPTDTVPWVCSIVRRHIFCMTKFLLPLPFNWKLKIKNLLNTISGRIVKYANAHLIFFCFFRNVPIKTERLILDVSLFLLLAQVSDTPSLDALSIESVRPWPITQRERENELNREFTEALKKRLEAMQKSLNELKRILGEKSLEIR